MKKYYTEEFQVKVISFLMVFLLIVVLVPLFWIAKYNFCSADDFAFAKNAKDVWEQTHSLWALFMEQIKFTIDMYYSWQGTFFSTWFVAVMLGLFIDGAYYMGTVLSLGGLVICEMIAFVAILTKALGADKYRALIMSCCCIIMQVLLTPVPNEGFYWFVGAVVYTFFYNLAWLLVAMIVWLYHSDNMSKWKKILLIMGIALCSLAIAGSNYVIALIMGICYVGSVLYFFWRKNRNKYILLGNMIFYFAIFAINVVAPGNGVRQNELGTDPMSPVLSVLVSLKEAGIYLVTNGFFPYFVLGLMLVPIIWKIVKVREYKFAYPVIFSIVSFGLFAAQFTPTLYAQGITGPGRILNIYRFNMFVFWFANEIYWIGWFRRRWREADKWNDKERETKSYLLGGWLLSGIMLCVGLGVWGGDTLTSVSAALSIRRGEAQQYYAEHQERLTVLEDDSIKEAYVDKYTVGPYLLYFGDITENTDSWINQTVAKYYDKELVGVEGYEVTGK